MSITLIGYGPCSICTSANSRLIRCCRRGGPGVDDSVFYRQMGLPLAGYAIRIAQDGIFRTFCKAFPPRPTAKVLDIGVANETNPHANFFERRYPYEPMVTCAGLSDGGNFRVAFPQIAYVQIAAHDGLPFADREFDVVFCNAVLEHVGGREQRRRFVSEALRVGRDIFIAVPNRWFPVEHHSGLPLLHFMPALYRRALKTTRLSYWSEQEHLDFLSARSLRRELAEWSGARVTHCGIRLGMFSSNVAAIWSRGNEMAPRS